MKKGCKNHRETLYSSKGKIVYVVIFIVGKSYSYHSYNSLASTLGLHWVHIIAERENKNKTSEL